MSDPYNDLTYFDKSITYYNNYVVGNPYVTQEGFTYEELLRINTELLFWRFYRGSQWINMREQGEPQNTINYCRAFVDKSIAFLMGKGFTIDVKPEADEITKPVLDEVWADNVKELIALDIAQSGGVTGNAWVKIALEKFDEKEEPVLAEMYPKGRIRLMVLPSYSVFPTWDAHDKDKMNRCRIIYPLNIEEVRADGTVDRKTIWYKEDITKEFIKEYYSGDLIDTSENALGIIPIVRIKNLPLCTDSLGISDLQDIIPLQVEFNSKTTDVSDIINYHAAPVTVIYGAKATGLEKGARKIWGGLPKDAKVENLELKSDLSAAMNYITLLKNAMFELAHIPSDALGQGDGKVSNTSGIALHIKNQPLMELTKQKWVTYGEGIRQINRIILLYAKLIEYDGFDIEKFEKLTPVQKFWNSVKFSDPLPKDELIQMQLLAQKISLFLKSRKDALIELGEDEAAEKLEEILAEAKMIQDEIYSQLEEEEDDDNLDVNIGGIVHKTEKANSFDKEDDE